jgi:hypothetical protein
MDSKAPSDPLTTVTEDAEAVNQLLGVPQRQLLLPQYLFILTTARVRRRFFKFGRIFLRILVV